MNGIEIIPVRIDRRRRPLLSKRARLVLKCIIDYKRDHDGNSPTIREMCAITGIGSTSVIDYYLDRLETAGKIERNGDRGNARSISIPGARWLPPDMEL